MNHQAIAWTKHDLAQRMPERLQAALHEAKETLPAVVRTGLVLFVESIEGEGAADFPRYSSAKASPPPE